MPDYRVVFPDGEAWKIKSNKRGDAALEDAWRRANQARVLAEEPKPSVPFKDVTVERYTPELRARLKGLPYLDDGGILRHALRIHAEYERKGLRLTLRGMYYQFVSRSLLASSQAEYDRVGTVLSKARLRGTFPIDGIDDIGRTLYGGPSHRSRGGEVTRYDIDVSYAEAITREWIPNLGGLFLHIDRWYRQLVIPIVLFEKAALENVFASVCRQHDVSFMATKGYPSLSSLVDLHRMMVEQADHEVRQAEVYLDGFDDLDPTSQSAQVRQAIVDLWDSAETDVLAELETSGLWAGDEDPEEADLDNPALPWSNVQRKYTYGPDLAVQETHVGCAGEFVILYLGDHDPDGMEIPLDLVRRLQIVQMREGQVIPFRLERIGLNQDQIKRYNPPPFWAKPSSARYAKYQREHAWAEGNAWELDALSPEVLQQLLTSHLEALFDDDVHETNVRALEAARKEFLIRLPRLLSEIGGAL